MRKRIMGMGLAAAALMPLMLGAGNGEAVGVSSLKLVDNFADREASARLWTPLTRESARIGFEAGRVVMDMPGGPSGGGRCQLYSKTAFRLTRAGDALRFTWDMKILEDREQGYGYGLVLGDPAGAHIVAAQMSRRGGVGVAHAIFLSGPDLKYPNDQKDHGTGAVHLDLTVTLEDAATRAVKLQLMAFERQEELDGTPEIYASRNVPISYLSSTGTLPAGDLSLMFCVERDDDKSDAYPNTPRSKMALSNVFAGVIEGRGGEATEAY